MTTKVDPRAVRVETSTSQSGPFVRGVVKVSSTIDRCLRDFFVGSCLQQHTVMCVYCHRSQSGQQKWDVCLLGLGVVDGGPTVNQRFANVTCLLECHLDSHCKSETIVEHTTPTKGCKIWPIYLVVRKAQNIYGPQVQIDVLLLV